MRAKGAEIQYDDIARLEAWREHLLDIGQVCVAVHWAIYDGGRGECGRGQACDEGRVFQWPLRNFASRWRRGARPRSRAALDYSDYSNPQIVRISHCPPPQVEKATESYSRRKGNPLDSQKVETALRTER